MYHWDVHVTLCYLLKAFALPVVESDVRDRLITSLCLAPGITVPGRLSEMVERVYLSMELIVTWELQGLPLHPFLCTPCNSCYPRHDALGMRQKVSKVIRVSQYFLRGLFSPWGRFRPPLA